MSNLLRSRLPTRVPAVGLIAVTLLLGCGIGESREDRIARVAASFASADYRTALIDLKNLVREEPQNADLRLRLAEALLLTGAPEVAAAEARKARELGAPNESVVRQLAAALIGAGRFQEALDELSRPELEPVADATLLRLRGEAFAGLGRLAEAREEFTDALAKDPQDVAARLGLAAVLEQLDGSDAAKREIDRALELAPQELDAHLALARWFIRAGEQEQAYRAFTAALPLARQRGSMNEAPVVAALAEIELARGQVKEAQVTLAKLEKLAPKSDAALLLRARSDLMQGRPRDAQPLLQEVLSRDPQHAQANLLLGIVSAELGNLGQAEAHLAQAVRARPDDALARRLLADVRIRLHRPGDARDIIGTPETVSDPDLLALAGTASALLGDLDSAIRYFERGHESAGGAAGSALTLAAAYLANGRHKDALGLLRELQVPDSLIYQREALLLGALVAGKQTEAAKTEARRFAAERPRDLEALLVAAQGLLSAGDAGGARELIRQASRIDAQSTRPWVMLGRLEWSQEDLAAADAAFDQALSRDPRDIDALMGKAQLAAVRGDMQSTISHLEAARAASDAAIAPRVALARARLAQGDTSRAAEVLAEARAHAPEDPQLRAFAGLVAVARGQGAEAIEILEPLVRERPDNAGLHATLARAYALANRMSDARRANARALELDPKYWPALQMATRLAIAEADVPRATTHLARLRDVGAPAMTLKVLEADLAARKGEHSEAARLYGEIRAAAPSETVLLREFAARRAAGMSDAAEPIKAWLDQHPQSTAVRFAFAQHLQDTGDLGGALREYETLVQHAPRHAAALNNLAWLKLEAGETAEGLELARRAFELDPMPSIADTYGWALVRANRHREAIPVLQKAYEGAPQVAEIRYHLAVALAEAGRAAEARAHLRAIVQPEARFAGAEDARALLESLQKGLSR